MTFPLYDNDFFAFVIVIFSFYLFIRFLEKQIKELLDYQGAPYVRCAGFLYLRFCCNPEHLWDWFGKYLLDEEGNNFYNKNIIIPLSK